MATAINKATADTHVISARPCEIKRLTVNGGVMGSITIYDNASAGSGTKLATIAAPLAGDVFEYGAAVANGITIVTAAATDLTVVIE